MRLCLVKVDERSIAIGCWGMFDVVGLKLDDRMKKGEEMKQGIRIEGKQEMIT